MKKDKDGASVEIQKDDKTSRLQKGTNLIKISLSVFVSKRRVNSEKQSLLIPGFVKIR